MKHTSFLKSLKTLKSKLTKKKIPHSDNDFNLNKKISCTCKDSKGELKTLYKTHNELEYILASKSINLKSYPCPYEQGWHLTKD